MLVKHLLQGVTGRPKKKRAVLAACQTSSLIIPQVASLMAAWQLSTGRTEAWPLSALGAKRVSSKADAYFPWHVQIAWGLQRLALSTAFSTIV